MSVPRIDIAIEPRKFSPLQLCYFLFPQDPHPCPAPHFPRERRADNLPRSNIGDASVAADVWADKYRYEISSGDASDKDRRRVEGTGMIEIGRDGP